MKAVHYRNGDGHCARCSGELLRVIIVRTPHGDGGPGAHMHLKPLCGQCATPHETAYADTTAACPGCGIMMNFSRRDAYTTRWIACSTRCYQRAWRSSHRIKTRTCEVCRTEFPSPRKDARFCSGACRQWQYRLRRKGSPAAQFRLNPQ